MGFPMVTDYLLILQSADCCLIFAVLLLHFTERCLLCGCNSTSTICWLLSGTFPPCTIAILPCLRTPTRIIVTSVSWSIIISEIGVECIALHQSFSSWLLLQICEFICDNLTYLTKRTFSAALIWSYWLAYDLRGFPAEAARAWTGCCRSCEFCVQRSGHLCFLSTGGTSLPCPSVSVTKSVAMNSCHVQYMCNLMSVDDNCVYAWCRRI